MKIIFWRFFIYLVCCSFFIIDKLFVGNKKSSKLEQKLHQKHENHFLSKEKLNFSNTPDFLWCSHIFNKFFFAQEISKIRSTFFMIASGKKRGLKIRFKVIRNWKVAEENLFFDINVTNTALSIHHFLFKHFLTCYQKEYFIY